jgi:LysM repeat protein
VSKLLRRALTMALIAVVGLIAGASENSVQAVAPHQDAAPTDSPVIFAAGDISNCTNEEDYLTAFLMDGSDAPILALGDNAYEIGSLQEYNDCYGPSWGQHKERTYPVPGNHEYGDQGQSGYWTYWGDVATPLEPGCRENCKGYYSFNVGDWHIVALNSELDTDAGSEQEQWLRADLAANPAACTLAFWHRPRFTSGRYYARTAGHGLFQALYDYGADVVLVGHDHSYERFAPQSPAGEAEYGRGVRQFVVGTGGAPTRDFRFIQPNSEARNSETHGVIKLTLHPTSYDWEFLPIPGQTFTDSGSTDCVQLASLPPAPEGVSAETIGTAPAAAEENATSTDVSPSSAAAASAPGGIYTVKAGDTVSLIGLRFGVPWQDIAAANDLSGDYVIEIGQELIIPGVDEATLGAATAAPDGDAEANAPGSAPVVPQTPPSARSTAPASGATYVVEAGDTLFGIAVRNGLTWQELAAANGLTESSLLQIGQELIIPGATPAEESAQEEDLVPIAPDEAESL